MKKEKQNPKKTKEEEKILKLMKEDKIDEALKIATKKEIEFLYRIGRELVENSKYLEVETCGRFDTDTDVDVFILHIIKSSLPKGLSFNIVNNNTNTTSNYFDICVGSVVPHRDPEKGQTCKYLHAKNTHFNKVVERIDEKKRYAGKTFKAPFLTIRRTSSPSDNPRCKVSVINSRGKIAVENHLIVLKPKNQSRLRLPKNGPKIS